MLTELIFWDPEHNHMLFQIHRQTNASDRKLCYKGWPAGRSAAGLRLWRHIDLFQDEKLNQENNKTIRH